MAARSLRLRIAAQALLLGIACFVIAGCSREAPKSTREVPAYPGASELTEKSPGPNDTLLNIYKSVEFSTGDSPEAVLKWYRETLTGEGWQLDAFQPDPNGITFRWESYERPPATYLCVVSVRPGSGSKGTATGVTVEMRYNPGS
jgi:hypothetical protein